MITVQLTDEQVRQASESGAVVLTEEQAKSVRGKLNGVRGGRPAQPRCACGMYTAGVAESRNHTCKQTRTKAK